MPSVRSSGSATAVLRKSWSLHRSLIRKLLPIKENKTLEKNPNYKEHCCKFFLLSPMHMVLSVSDIPPGISPKSPPEKNANNVASIKAGLMKQYL